MRLLETDRFDFMIDLLQFFVILENIELIRLDDENIGEVLNPRNKFFVPVIHLLQIFRLNVFFKISIALPYAPA